MESNAQSEQNQTGLDTTGFVIAPMAAAAALDTAALDGELGSGHGKYP